MSGLNHNNFLVNGVKLSSSNKNIKPSFDFKAGPNVGVTWNYIQGSCEGPKSLFRNIETGAITSFTIPTSNCDVFEFKIACTTNNCFIAWKENYSSSKKKIYIGSVDNTGYVKDNDYVDEYVLGYDLAIWKGKAVLAYTKESGNSGSVKAEVFYLKSNNDIDKSHDLYVRSSSCFEKEPKIASNGNVFSISYNEVCGGQSQIETSFYDSNSYYIQEVGISNNNAASKVNDYSYMLSNGNTVFTWSEANNVYYSLLDSNRNVLNNKQLVTSYASGYVAAQSSVIGYEDKFAISYVSTYPGVGLYLQRYTATGQKFGNTAKVLNINDVNSFDYSVKSYNSNAVTNVVFTWADKYSNSFDVFQGYRRINDFFDRTVTNTTSESISSANTESKSRTMSESRSKSENPSQSFSATTSVSESMTLSKGNPPTESLSESSSPSDTATQSMSESSTETGTASRGAAGTRSPSVSGSESYSQTKTVSPSDTASSSESLSISNTNTETSSISDSGSRGDPPTHSSTSSDSASLSNTLSSTTSESQSHSDSKSLSATASESQSQSLTQSESSTASESRSASSSSSVSQTQSSSDSGTHSASSSQTFSGSMSGSETHELSQSQSISLRCDSKNTKIKLVFDYMMIVDESAMLGTSSYNVSTSVISSNSLNQAVTQHPTLVIDHETKDYANSFYDYVKPNNYVRSGKVSYTTRCSNNIEKYKASLGSEKDRAKSPPYNSVDWYYKETVPNFCLAASNHQ